MTRYIMQFSKTGTSCYISHLDLVRVFHRAFKRAGIKPVSYTHLDVYKRQE